MRRFSLVVAAVVLGSLTAWAQGEVEAKPEEAPPVTVDLETFVGNGYLWRGANAFGDGSTPTVTMTGTLKWKATEHVLITAGYWHGIGFGHSLADAWSGSQPNPFLSVGTDVKDWFHVELGYQVYFVVAASPVDVEHDGSVVLSRGFELFGRTLNTDLQLHVDAVRRRGVYLCSSASMPFELGLVTVTPGLTVAVSDYTAARDVGAGFHELTGTLVAARNLGQRATVSALVGVSYSPAALKLLGRPVAAVGGVNLALHF